MNHPMSTPAVSIITVNYNEPEETEFFLESVYKSTFDSFEVLVVDNGSKRKIDSNLEKKYPNLTCIINDENLGFAGGNNLGVNKAKGEYLLFLNNDTLIPEDFLSIMTEFMKSHPDAGMSSPKINFTTGQIQYAGARQMNKFTGRGKKYGNKEIDQGQYDHNKITDLPHGAAMMVPKKVIDKVGTMFEDYFLYYEEHDWALRIKNAGYQIYYVGSTHIVHKESVSVGPDSPLKAYYMSRNRLLFQIRNYAGLDRLLSIIFFLFLSLPKSSIKYLIKGKKRQLANIWRGTLWHLNKSYVFKG